MITLKDVSFEFSGRWLYRQLNWQLKEGDRIGLIGRNGCGKSTLLRLLVGQYQPTEGEIQKPKNLKIGFLNQDLLSFKSNESVLNIALKAFHRAQELQQSIQAELKRFESAPTDALLLAITEKQQEFELIGGYEIEARAHEVLNGLGFAEPQRHKPFNTFSGGWRMRALLAKILLEEPDLLLLDEPTNHLDLPSIEWVEQYIKKFKGAYIVVSHDRYFLDKMAEDTVEIASGKLNFYPGNFSDYLEEKMLRAELQKAAYDNQQKKIEHIERFVERFKAKATKAKQAQSRVKMLDRIERIDAPEDDAPVVSFRFSFKVRPGIDVLSLTNISKNFGDTQVLKNTNATIRRGDKIGLIGANGLGKSTLLRIIAQTEPAAGNVQLGHNVIHTFYAQHQIESLNLENNLVDELLYYSSEKNETFVRNTLGSFLFTGDDVYKKIKVLSGGEKARVALARTLLSEANFLLLDEPTNHLDMQSTEILVEALQQYEGTYIVVSHDRYFLSEVTNKTWYIENFEIKEYPGSFIEYQSWKSQQVATLQGEAKSKSIAQTVSAPPKSDYKAQRQLQNQLKSLEQKIERLENEKKQIEQTMVIVSNESNYAAILEQQSKLEKIQSELTTNYQAWENLILQIEG